MERWETNEELGGFELNIHAHQEVRLDGDKTRSILSGWLPGNFFTSARGFSYQEVVLTDSEP
jgi:hypothetical protein